MNRDPRKPVEAPDYEAATLAIIMVVGFVVAAFIGVLLAIIAATMGLVHHG